MGSSTMATEQELSDRIADAEVEFERAKVQLNALRGQAGMLPIRDTFLDGPDAVGEDKYAILDDRTSRPDDIVDAIAAESAASSAGVRDPLAEAIIYDNHPYIPTKDHVAAGLLAIVLGCLGIHKFYLGYTTAGFVMLGATIVGGVLTMGVGVLVMMLVGVVEGILYLTSSQSRFERTHVEHVREWF